MCKLESKKEVKTKGVNFEIVTGRERNKALEQKLRNKHKAKKSTFYYSNYGARCLVTYQRTGHTDLDRAVTSAGSLGSDRSLLLEMSISAFPLVICGVWSLKTGDWSSFLIQF